MSRRSFSRLPAYMSIIAMIVSGISGAGMASAPPTSAAPAATASAAPAAAAFTGADFDPGNIISDENFFNPNALGAAQVQSFIDSKVTCATGAVCLANLRVDTFDIAATPMCSAYQGAPQESAATIIYKVGRACGISQAVILVTLQKEQSLVTSRAPSMHALSAAMGAGCYDNGQPCIDEYAGFFNQVFNGAYLLKRYTQPPGTGPGTPYTSRYDLSYPVGRTSNILVSTRNCGTLPVYVTNQATHSLYVYTPYTPNAAALGNLYGLGDDCSSYGNRNFWVFYYTWFGNPLVPIAPFGWFDGVSAVGTTVTATGWAIDGHTPNSIEIRLSVDGGPGAAFPANIPYPNLGTAYPGFGDNHGFAATTMVSPGTHSFCVTAVNTASGTSRGLGCRTLTVSSANTPIGWLDRVYQVGTQATVEGWVIDRDTASPISVRVTVDGGAAQTFAASNAYAGLGGAYPGFGDNHGFSGTVTVPVGKHTVCVTAVNDAGTPDQEIGCRIVTATSQPPFGWVDSVTARGRMVTASGWAIDRDTASPISVQLSVDGGDPQSFTASNTYAGLGGAYPGFGDGHGFAATVVVPVGTHTVCITAINNEQGPDRELSCREVVVSGANSPIGWLDSFSATGSTVTAAGWAFDPDTVSPVVVQLVVDGGVPQEFLAGNAYPGLGGAYPGFGDNHGFTASAALLPGMHSVCAIAVNDVPGTDRVLGCTTFTIP